MVRFQEMFVMMQDLLILTKERGQEAWFSSDLINFYIKFSLSSKNICVDTQKYCVLDCYLYQRLPRPRGFELNSRVINAHTLSGTFENCSNILLPIFMGGNHWIAIEIDRISKVINIMDSQNPHKGNPGYKNETLEDNITSFLDCRLPGSQFESSEFIYRYQNMVQQIDGTNCGPMVLLNIFEKLNVIHFRIENTQTFFRNLRLIMFHELISGCDFVLNML